MPEISCSAPIGSWIATQRSESCAFAALEHAEEVGALAVEHVHEDEAGELVLVGALPHAHRVHLDAHHRGDDDQGAFDDAKRGERVGLEARVARAVDEVDLAVLPVDVQLRAGEGHLALVLVVVPVGDGRALLDRAEPRRLSGLEEERLHERGLADATVPGDGDVADLARLGNGCHGLIVNQVSRPARAGEPESRALRRRIAFVWSCETRDSVTPSTSPISRRVSSS